MAKTPLSVEEQKGGKKKRFIKYLDDLSALFGINAPFVDAREMLLHMSDTPHTIYPYLRRTLKRLKPAYIVHTGDFVDNLKLECRPGLIDLYKKRVKKFLSVFDEEDYGAILITGNHDDAETLLKERRNASVQIWTSPGRFSVGNFTFRAGHRYEDVCSSPARYNLFGHSLEHKTRLGRDGNIYLNGIQAMYLVHIFTGEVAAVPYPHGTDAERLLRRRVSI